MARAAILVVMVALAGCTGRVQTPGSAAYVSPNTPDPRDAHIPRPPLNPPRTGIHIHGHADIGIVKTF
jgi:hypothetical protein